MKNQRENMEWSVKKILKRILSSTISSPQKKNKCNTKEYKNKWYRENRTKNRNTQLKYKFGITLEEYNLMVQSQGGVCAICEGVNDTRRRGTHNGENVVMSLAVDHNHKTGKVRGLLCSGCNTSLGQFKDDPLLLQKAIKYLEQAKKNNVQTTT